MGRPKKDKEEILTKRRLAARKRQERIRNDPVLHQQQKETNKERYNRRKHEKKILTVSEMTEKERKKVQKRNRDNFRAYYKRKKGKQLEVPTDDKKLDYDKQDPLYENSSPSASTSLSYTLRSKASDKSSLKHEVSTDLIDQDVTQKTSNCNSSDMSPVEHKVTIDLIDHYPPQRTSNDSTFINELSQSSECTMALTPRLSRVASASSDTTVITEKNLSEDNADYMVQDTSPCASPSSNSSVYSRRSVEKSKLLINSSTLVFKRYKYKVNKEMAMLRRKIEELKKENKKFRKQVLRLKNMKMLPKKRAQKEKKIEHKETPRNDIQTFKEEIQIDY